ncbi:hypothetical protein CAC42_1218 [Sphaceloma murrayae]|uniref:Uncharacterized protein n=1 Tax=Sphaceloma murrayae TaxID=2082308 RepID=A0A2K1R2B2_9PEZI|nr:hypothetical protein CAC42_1218 [Sphaceloma murrayae]
MGKRIIVARQWRLPKAVLAFFAVEFCLTVAALALFGIADPNLYRTKLWLDGALNGFNSHPEQVLYAYANHEKPVIPLVWSQTWAIAYVPEQDELTNGIPSITTFNLVISILSTFLLLVKSVMFVMKTWFPIISLCIHMALTALYTFSTYAQLSSDKSDPTRIQDGPPWYITKSCDVVHNPGNYGYCRQAKASMAVAAAMAGILFIQIILALISIVPSELEKHMRGVYDHDELDDEFQHGEVVMYQPEKPDEFSYYSPQTPLQAHPYSPLPQKKPIDYQNNQTFELSDLTSKADLEARRHSQQYPRYSNPPRPTSYTPQPPAFTPQPNSLSRPVSTNPPQQAQSTFTTNLLTQYLQHSPAGRAITTSEPTPPPTHSPAPPSTRIVEIPVFEPPPAAGAGAVAPTPRTVAFQRLTGRGKTEAEKIDARKKKDGRAGRTLRSRPPLFSRGRERDEGAGPGTSTGTGARPGPGPQRDPETRKERKIREAREKEDERKRQVERYFELQRAGPPGYDDNGEVVGGWDVGHGGGAAATGVRGYGQSGGLPFRERYGG